MDCLLIDQTIIPFLGIRDLYQMRLTNRYFNEACLKIIRTSKIWLESKTRHYHIQNLKKYGPKRINRYYDRYITESFC